jgi:hypothetical protein
MSLSAQLIAGDVTELEEIMDECECLREARLARISLAEAFVEAVAVSRT